MEFTDRFLTYAGWTIWAWLPPSIALAIATALAFRQQPSEGIAFPPVTELWVVVLVPAVSLLWGAVAYEYGAGARGSPALQRSHWAFHVLDALTLLSVLTSALMVYRHRRRLALGIPVALFGTAFALFAWFIGSMSIGND